MMHEYQIHLIEMIQQYRSPALDTFFIFWKFFDSHWFFILLIPLIWLWAGWVHGIRCSYLFLMSAFANVFVKAYFALPRPCQLQDGLQLIDIKGFGFPSGAAQTAIIVFLLTRPFWKNRIVLFGALLFSLILSFSRIYLGVHFFTDVLGGWAVGACVYLIYHVLYAIIVGILRKTEWITQVILAIGPPFLLIFLLGVDPRVSKYIPVFLGHGIATFCVFHLRRYWSGFASPRVKGLAYATVLTGTGLLYNIQDTFLIFKSGPSKEIFMGLYSVWGLFGAYAVCYLIFLRSREINKS